MEATVHLKSKYAVIAAALWLLGTTAASARADVILTAGNIPQFDENVLLSTALVDSVIFGETNQSHFPVRFSSNENLTAPASGQARVEAADGAFSQLAISLLGGDFTSLILNLDATADGTVDFSALDTTGGVFNFDDVAIDGSGQNFFTFTTLHGQRIQSISLLADGSLGFGDVAQVRIGGGGLTVSQVPEPSAILLIGTAVVRWSRWRAKARTPAAEL
jgi:hypothetical protein